MTHIGLEENHCRKFPALLRLVKCVKDRLEIVSICYNDIPAEGLPLGLEVSLTRNGVHCSVNLLSVPVGDGDEIVQFVMGREHRSLPDLAFLALSVTAENIYPGSITVQFLAQSHAGSRREALSEGTGSLRYAWKSLFHRRMALKPGPELAEGGEFLHREETAPGKDGVVHRSYVPG